MQNTECHNSSAMKISTFSTSRVLITKAVGSGRWMMEIEGKLINKQTNRKLSCGRQNCTIVVLFRYFRDVFLQKLLEKHDQLPYSHCFYQPVGLILPAQLKCALHTFQMRFFDSTWFILIFFFSLLSFVNSGGYRESIKLMFRPENRQRLR
jgi:hypothetical protein